VVRGRRRSVDLRFFRPTLALALYPFDLGERDG
jgi:hypothetical protein